MPYISSYTITRKYVRSLRSYHTGHTPPRSKQPAKFNVNFYGVNLDDPLATYFPVIAEKLCQSRSGAIVSSSGGTLEICDLQERSGKLHMTVHCEKNGFEYTVKKSTYIRKSELQPKAISYAEFYQNASASFKAWLEQKLTDNNHQQLIEFNNLAKPLLAYLKEKLNFFIVGDTPATPARTKRIFNVFTTPRRVKKKSLSAKTPTATPFHTREKERQRKLKRICALLGLLESLASLLNDKQREELIDCCKHYEAIAGKKPDAIIVRQPLIRYMLDVAMIDAYYDTYALCKACEFRKEATQDLEGLIAFVQRYWCHFIDKNLLLEDATLPKLWAELKNACLLLDKELIAINKLITDLNIIGQVEEKQKLLKLKLYAEDRSQEANDYLEHRYPNEKASEDASIEILSASRKKFIIKRVEIETSTEELLEARKAIQSTATLLCKIVSGRSRRVSLDSTTLQISLFDLLRENLADSGGFTADYRPIYAARTDLGIASAAIIDLSNWALASYLARLDAKELKQRIEQARSVIHNNLISKVSMAMAAHLRRNGRLNDDGSPVETRLGAINSMLGRVESRMANINTRLEFLRAKSTEELRRLRDAYKHSPHSPLFTRITSRSTTEALRRQRVLSDESQAKRAKHDRR